MNIATAQTYVPEEFVESAYRKLFEEFENISPLPVELKALIREKSEVLVFKPKDVLLNYLQVCKFGLFIARGMVKIEYVVDGEEKIIGFQLPGDWCIAAESFFEQTPSDEKLTTLKETIGIAMSREDLKGFLSNYTEFNTLMRIIAEKHFVLLMNRFKMFQHSTADKIRYLEEHYPALVKVVPMTDRANYLGMTPKTYMRNRPEKN